MKKKKRLIMSCLFALLCTGMASAGNDTWVYVATSSGEVTANGTAAFESSKGYTLKFDESGNALMVYNNTTNVAKLLASEITAGYALIATTATQSGTVGSITKAIGSGGYATLYSPFAVTVPESGVEYYAPTYQKATGTLLLDASTKVSGIVPPRTGIVLKGTDGNATISFADGTGTADSKTGCLFGSAITAASPSTTNTFGINSDGSGFTKYATATLALTEAYYLNDDAITPVVTDNMAFSETQSTVTVGSFFAYVKQTLDDAPSVVTADGLNSYEEGYTLAFDNGNAVIKNASSKVVVSLPVNTTTNGQLVVDTKNSSGIQKIGGLSYKIPTGGYGTLYSPFNIAAPTAEGVAVYAPKLNNSKNVVLLNSSNKIGESSVGTVVPSATPLVIVGTGGTSYEILFSATEGTAQTTEGFEGTALKIAMPTKDSYTLCTMGSITKNSVKKYGFYKYEGTATQMPAGKVWLFLPSSQAKAAAEFSFDDATGICSVNSEETSANRNGKFLENGNIVIVKNGRKYYVNGQEVK